ncbi:MAG: cell division protein ZapA [Desulfuromonas sp.]|nr:cell division protein ZapA [Desulfuromonas sp.]
MKQTVRVTILGQDYSIRSSRSIDEVQKVAAFVDARIAEVLAVGATADSMNAAVLALMNVAGSCFELQQQLGDAQKITESLLALDEKISLALPDS